MKITALVSFWGCVVFGLMCTGFALNGFASLPAITDQAARDDSLGFAWFWAFLALVAAIFGVLSWLMKEGKFGPIE